MALRMAAASSIWPKQGFAISDTHADTAIDEAAARQPDIIVLDFAYDGDLTERLKAHEATRQNSRDRVGGSDPTSGRSTWSWT